MKRKQAILALSFALALSGTLTACQSKKTQSDAYEDATLISLSDERIAVDGADISQKSEDAVYAANDIVFYLEGQDFTYGEGTEADEHSQAEADAHTVVHITEPGAYRLSGSLSAGQIAVDLGEDASEDPEAVVTLILDGVDVDCSVAPAIIFYNVYECGSDDTAIASKDVDTSAAGANVVIADDSINNITGSYVARIYKSYELSEDGTEVVDSKKLHKYDGAFYSKRSMNITGGEEGNGVLNITAENEGLDSEMHLTINGGNINIVSGNDGINTNEDGISVTTINDGTLNIQVDGATGEGDGIDSNGWLVINGGTVIAEACSTSGDAGIDSDMGIHVNGGTVIATGNMLDRLGESSQNYAVFTFDARQTGQNAYTLKNANGEIVYEHTPNNDFTYFVVSSPALAEGDYTFWCNDTQLAGSSNGMGGGMMGGHGMMEGQEPPEGMEIPDNMQRPEMPQGTEIPEGMQPPEMPEGTKIPEGMQPPEMPEGTEIPEGMQMPAGKTSTTFSIINGGNMFQITTKSSSDSSL